MTSHVNMTELQWSVQAWCSSVAVIFHCWVMYWIILEFWNFHDCVSSHTSFLMSCGGSCLLTRQSTAFSACHHTRDRILYLEPWITCPSPRHYMESQISKPKLTEISLICSTLHYTTLQYTTLIRLLSHSLTHSFIKLACHSGSWISFFQSWTIINAYKLWLEEFSLIILVCFSLKPWTRIT